MHPFFNILGIEVPAYGLFVAIGTMAAAFYLVLTYRQRGYTVKDVSIMGICWGIGILLGGKILYALTVISHYLPDLKNAESFAEFTETLSYLFGGAVFYGGLTGGVLLCVVGCKLLKINCLNFLDYVAPSIPLFHAFGRVGCFFSGCCYGVESQWGFIMTDSLLPSGNGVCRFPIQLTEAAFNLILFAVLLYFQFKPPKRFRDGGILFTYLLTYGIYRFFAEFFRGDVIRGIWWGLSTSQWISIFLVVFSVGYLIFQKITQKDGNARNTVL